MSWNAVPRLMPYCSRALLLLCDAFPECRRYVHTPE